MQRLGIHIFRNCLRIKKLQCPIRAEPVVGMVARFRFGTGGVTGWRRCGGFVLPRSCEVCVVTADLKRVRAPSGIDVVRDVGELGSLILRAARRATAVHLVERATQVGTSDRASAVRPGLSKRL